MFIFQLLTFFLMLQCLYVKASEKNYVNLDLETLNFLLPENNSGNAGELIFSKAKLNWNEMRLSLKNSDQALNAVINIRPNLINFKTHRMNLTLPLSEESPLFNIKAAQLKESSIMVNKEFFNFSGEYFKIQNDAAIVTLDKFNSLCVGRDIDNLTTIDGLIAGCLNDFIINGKNENDLAGAKLEYTDRIDDMEIFFSSRLKDLKLQKNIFSLDLDNANLNAANYLVSIGKSNMSCKKNPELYSIDFEKIKNDCVDSFTVDSSEIEIQDNESATEYAVKLESLQTNVDQLEAKFDKVAIKTDEKLVELSGLTITCDKNQGDEFYELHKVISGCMKYSKIKLDLATTTGIEEEVERDQTFWDEWFADGNSEVSKFNATLGNLTVNNGEIYFIITVDTSLTPKFNISIKGEIVHDPENKTLTIHMDKVKVAKIPTWRWGVNKILNFWLDMENIKFIGKKITIQL